MMTKDGENTSQNDSLQLIQTQVMTPSIRLAVGHNLVHRFDILEFIGEGQFGSVYKAYDRQLDSTIAIKLLHSSLSNNSSALADFKNEVLTLRKLSHPNILRVHEYYQDALQHFITMDWIQGESLDIKIQAQTLTIEKIKSYASQIILALGYAEANNIIHCDLKPENILIDSRDKVTIADFGLAIMQQSNQGNFQGSPIYCAPEYILATQVNQTTDLYSLGVILFQMCCGQLPFLATDFETLCNEKSIGCKKFPATHEKLNHYSNLTLRLISPYHTARPQSIDEVARLFSEVQPKLRKVNKFVVPLLTLVTLAGILISYLVQDSPTVTREKYHSLAILPIANNSSDSTYNQISFAIPEFLYRSLKDNPSFRLVDNERVADTIRLLGFELPLNPSQLQVVSELLQVDYLLQSKFLTVAINNHELTSELINIVGSSIDKQTLLQKNIDTNATLSTVNQLVSIIEKTFDLERIDDELIELSKSELELLAEVHRLIQQKNSQQAELRLKELLAENTNYTSGWKLLGDLHLQNGNYSAAEKAFLSVKQNTHPGQLIYQLAEANLYRLANKIEKEMLIFEKLVIEYPFNSEIRFRLSNIYAETNQLANAEALLKQIVAQDSNHPTAWYELAKLAIVSGEMRSAIDEYLVRALIIANRLNDKASKGDVLNAIGVAYQRLGEIDNAIEYYNQALQARIQSNNLPGTATTLSNIAALLAIRGDYQQAVSYLNQGLKIYQELTDLEGIGNLYNELGILSEEQGNYTDALEFFRKSLAIRMDFHDEWLKAESLNNVGYIYFLLADDEHAMIYWQQAEQYFEKSDDPVGVLRVKQNYGQLALQKGNWKDAYQIFENSLNQAKKLALVEERFVAQAFLAKIAFVQGGFSNARTALSSILEQLNQRKDVRGIIEFSLWATEWNYLCGDFEAAKTLLERVKPLVFQQGNQEQRLLFAILQKTSINSGSNFIENEKIDLQASSEHSEIPIPIKLKYILTRAENSLLNERDKFPELVEKLKSLNISAYPYEHINLLELEVFNALKNNDWLEVESKIEQAEALLKQLGNYWRKFQFLRLRAVLLKQQGKVNSGLIQNAEEELAKLKSQLAESHQHTFVLMQDRLVSGMELSGEFVIYE